MICERCNTYFFTSCANRTLCAPCINNDDTRKIRYDADGDPLCPFCACIFGDGDCPRCIRFMNKSTGQDPDDDDEDWEDDDEDEDDWDPDHDDWDEDDDDEDDWDDDDEIADVTPRPDATPPHATHWPAPTPMKGR